MNLRQSLVWSSSQQFLQYGLQFIGSIVIARLLTPAEMGVFSLAMAASVIIDAIRNFGIGNYLIKEEKLNDEKIRSAFAIWLLISCSMGLALVFSRNEIAEFYQEPGLADVLLILAFNFFITPFGQPAHALLTREMRFNVLHHISLTCGLVGLISNITLAYLGFSYLSLAWGLIISTTLRSILLISTYPRHITMLPSLKYWRSVLGFGGSMTLVSLMGTTNTEGIKFIIGYALNTSSLALYERAFQLPKLTRFAFMTPLLRVLTPAYSKAIREGKNIEGTYTKVISYSSSLIWPIFLTMSLLSESIIVTLFGENWRVAGTIMPYFLLSQGLNLMTSSSNPILIAFGKVKYLMISNTVVAASSLILAVITLHISLEAFAISRVGVSIIQVALFSFCVFLAAKISFLATLNSVRKSILVTVIAALPAIIYRMFYSDAADILTLAAIALVSMITWAGAIAITRHPIINELKAIKNKLR